jgi:hypothetical protein
MTGSCLAAHDDWFKKAAKLCHRRCSAGAARGIVRLYGRAIFDTENKFMDAFQGA